MLGHPVAENPIDRMFAAVYAHNGLAWQFWKNNIAMGRPGPGGEGDRDAGGVR
jgi:shikimate dehydrogenase